MTTHSRPLSPHLQVYRFQWTMALSIVHRITGAGLAVGTILLVWWLLALAAGPDYYAYVQGLLGTWLGRLLLFGWSWALFYHLCNGIRHLCWDAVWGFEIRTAFVSGMLVAAASIVLTLLAWSIAYGLLGV